MAAELNRFSFGFMLMTNDSLQLGKCRFWSFSNNNSGTV
jgi:hypothetical protein